MLVISPENLAVAVVNQRKKLKLSQAAVGERVGLKQVTVSAFENKPASTKLDTLFRILSSVGMELTVSPKGESNADKKPWTEEW